MNKVALIYLSSIAAVIILLLLLSTSSTNSGIRAGLKERENRNLLQDILDSTKSQSSIITEDLKGKTIVINVWATWCMPCIQEIPKLNELVEEFASDDIRFIALDDMDSTKEVKVMKERDIDFDYELYFDQKKLINLLYSFKLDHESRAIPLNIVINSEGKAKFYYMGNHSKKIEEIREYLSAL